MDLDGIWIVTKLGPIRTILFLLSLMLHKRPLGVNVADTPDVQPAHM